MMSDAAAYTTQGALPIRRKMDAEQEPSASGGAVTVTCRLNECIGLFIKRHPCSLRYLGRAASSNRIHLFNHQPPYTTETTSSSQQSMPPHAILKLPPPRHLPATSFGGKVKRDAYIHGATRPTLSTSRVRSHLLLPYGRNSSTTFVPCSRRS